jgi:hypothetical protein
MRCKRDDLLRRGDTEKMSYKRDEIQGDEL